VTAPGILLGCASNNEGFRLKNGYREFLKMQSASYDDKSTNLRATVMTDEEHQRLGDLFYDQGNLSKAFIHYEKSLLLNPGNTQVRYKKGLLLVIGRLNEEAIKDFKAVLEKNSKDAPSYVGLGLASFQMQKYGEAEENFQKAIELDPKLWKAHNMLGVIYDHKKSHKKAVQHYRTAIRLQPTSALLYNNLALSYSLREDYAQAVEFFHKALDVKEAGSFRERIYNNLGMALAKLGKYSQALEAFTKGGDRAQAHNNLGCVYLHQGQREKAIQSFNKALEVKDTFYLKALQNLKSASTFY
jgi:tetratricopeptide (TPR) repeat protein